MIDINVTHISVTSYIQTNGVWYEAPHISILVIIFLYIIELLVVACIYATLSNHGLCPSLKCHMLKEPGLL
jgi:hypothetical protein